MLCCTAVDWKIAESDDLAIVETERAGEEGLR